MRNILLIGGTGFVGSAVVRRLAKADFRACVPTRRRERAKHLLVLPTVEVVEADVHDEAVLRRLMRGQDAVINLVGILVGGEPRRSGNGEMPRYGAGFARAHVELPRKLAVAASAAGVRRVLHVSALQAAADAPSGYLRSKADGEAVLRRADLDLTIFRPSVIFGAGDAFLGLFAQLARIAPFFPLACADARFQPVWVNDVADCLVESLCRPESVGETYALCGPQEYRLRQLVALAAAYSGHPRAVIGLPTPLAWLQARAMEFLPNPPLTRDNLRSMQLPSVCNGAGGLPFGRCATALDIVAGEYL